MHLKLHQDLLVPLLCSVLVPTNNKRGRERTSCQAPSNRRVVYKAVDKLLFDLLLFIDPTLHNNNVKV